MENRKLKLLILTVSLGVATITISFWAKSALGLPAPRDCNRMQLGRWLVTQDLERVPHAVQFELIARIESELQTGWKPNLSSLPLADSQQSRFNANISTLKFQWFVKTCRDYASTPNEDRNDFLDRKIAFVQQVQRLQRESAKETLFEEIDSWNRQVTATDRADVDTALHAAVIRWLQTESLESMNLAAVSTLADRIADRLDDETMSEPPTINLSASNKTWQTNVEILTRAWFQNKAKTCEALLGSERSEFAVNILRRLRGWNLDVILSAPHGSDGKGNAWAAIAGLASKIERWIETSEPSDASRLKLFQSELQRALLVELVRSGRALLR